MSAPPFNFRLAEEHHIAWHTVRDAIEDGLRKRYRKRDYSKVVNIGIDELYAFRHECPSRRFITTVRDQDGGGVLEVAQGKGGVALKRSNAGGDGDCPFFIIRLVNGRFGGCVRLGCQPGLLTDGMSSCAGIAFASVCVALTWAGEVLV